MIRYDPQDISKLSVFKGGEWMTDVFAKELRLPDGSFLPTSQASYELARRLIIEGISPGTSWLNDVEELEETQEIRYAEKKTIQKESHRVPRGPIHKGSPPSRVGDLHISDQQPTSRGDKSKSRSVESADPNLDQLTTTTQGIPPSLTIDSADQRNRLLLAFASECSTKEK